MNMERTLLGHLTAISVIIVWGTTFVSSKVLLNNGLSPDEIFLWRCVSKHYVAKTSGKVWWFQNYFVLLHSQWQRGALSKLYNAPF